MRHALGLALAGLFGGGVEAAERCRASFEPAEPAIREAVPESLLRQANRGREILRPDGRFALPRGIRRVWIDVGAHHLETTRHELLRYDDLALVAIEPLAECWKEWPDSERLIGLPVALYLERGFMDFHVNSEDVTSSLARRDPGAGSIRTVEVRSVPVLRLEDVLDALPAELDVVYLKTDVQGVDLQVLQSAGEKLRRVYRVRAEVINTPTYEPIGAERPAGEAEMLAYMKRLGFRFVRDDAVQPGRSWLDKEFVNVECWSWADRLWQELRFGR